MNAPINHRPHNPLARLSTSQAGAISVVPKGMRIKHYPAKWAAGAIHRANPVTGGPASSAGCVPQAFFSAR